ncbi:MAG TPA: hypothetical protein VF040_07765 [Ktedonobacterales bacterium]
MEQRLVKLLGTAAKHTLDALRRALLAVAITGLLVALITAVATELVGFILTKQFSGPTHLAAAALALSFGYAVAATVFIGEILRAIVKIIEMIVEESEKVATAAIKEAEILARKAEQEAVHLGHAAVGDMGALGHGVGHIAGDVAGAIGGVASGAVHEAGNIEHGIASHMPGHHNS